MAAFRRDRVVEVFLVFLRLGCTSFGGPIAHLGYFQRELVERRRWCTPETYAEIVALAQTLPGPASSQVGFAMGLLRAGWIGGIAAWFGFTLLSALLMFAFAQGNALLGGALAAHALHGLELVAVAVVAQAVVSMQRSLAPDARRVAMALLAAAIVLFAPTHFDTPIAIALGAIAGLFFCRTEGQLLAKAPPSSITRSTGIVAGLIFVLLLAACQGVSRHSTVSLSAVASAFYRSGALVFGGGHVVLPLLESAVVAPGWVTQPTFLAGYGAAQALPGPLFSFGVYLGAVIGAQQHQTELYSVAALIAIFLPGMLAMAAVLPFWATLRTLHALRSVLAGINASVVGVLLAALIRPLATTALHSVADIAFAVAALGLLLWAKTPPWVVVLAGAVCAMILPRL